MVLGVNGVGLFARRIGEIKSAEVGGFKLDSDSAAFLIVGHGVADKIFIAGQIGGQRVFVFGGLQVEPAPGHLLLVTGEHFFLQRNIDAHIGSAGGLIVIVEGIEKRIDEENPVEALGIEVRRHEGAVGKAGFDVELVQDTVEVGLAAGCFGGFLDTGKPFGVLGFEVVVRILEEKFGTGDEFGIVVAETENAAFVGRRSHGIHVGIVGETRVGMVVVDGNGVNF